MPRAPCGAGTVERFEVSVMKKILFILAAILTAVVWYVYQDPKLSRKIEKEVKQLVPAPQPQTTTVYKWQDQNGQWQITDQPPPAGISFEALEYQSDTNIMPAEAITGQKPD